MPRLTTQTYSGFPDGSNLAVPPQELRDTEARYIQDALVNQEGITDRRGPLSPVAGMVAFTDKIVGIVQATDPQGTSHVAFLHGNGVNGYFSILSDDYASKVTLNLGIPLGGSPYAIVDSKPMLNGGAFIGISSQYDANAVQQQLIMWRGGHNADYSTGTITTSYGSRTVTGAGTSFTTGLSHGMFLFDSSNQLIGTIQSVENNTSLTLEEGAVIAVAGGAYTAKALRGWQPKVVTGHVTVGTGTASVTGANTKFLDQGVAAGWRMFKAETMAYVGTVLSVTSNTALTLTANAAVAMASDNYVLIDNTGDYTYTTKQAGKIGFLNGVYAERQWFANQALPADGGGEFIHRVWYSDPADPEAVDLTTVDGDYIPVTSARGVNSPIKAFVPAYNSAVILKENEAFALVGQNPNNFQVRKIGDDGVLSGMSAVPYEGGVVWAGRNGIYFYDGVEAENLVEHNLGSYYQAAIKGFDPKTYRMWGMVHRDHYFLHIERVTPPVGVIKGVVSSTPTQYTIVLYLPNRSVTFFTNVNFRGYTLLPASTGQNAWFVCNTSTVGKVCSIDALFDTDGNDPFGCDGGTAGPDFYIESKKYDAGDGLRKKLWKQLMLHYLVGGDSLRLDTIVGLNTTGNTSTSTWPVSVYWWDRLGITFSTWDSLAASHATWDSLVDSIYFIKRIKFLKRSQYLAFRIYQNSPSVTNARLAKFALGFKVQRPGRI